MRGVSPGEPANGYPLRSGSARVYAAVRALLTVALLGAVVLVPAGAAVPADCESGGDALPGKTNGTLLPTPQRCTGRFQLALGDYQDAYRFTADAGDALRITLASDWVHQVCVFAPSSGEFSPYACFSPSFRWTYETTAHETGTWAVRLTGPRGTSAPGDYELTLSRHVASWTGSIPLGTFGTVHQNLPQDAPATDGAWIQPPVPGTGHETAVLHGTGPSVADGVDLRFYDGDGVVIRNDPCHVENGRHVCPVPAGTEWMLVRSHFGPMDYTLRYHH